MSIAPWPLPTSAAQPCTTSRPRAPAAAALRVRHLTRYDYDAAVELAHHLAHLRPRETPWQSVNDWRIDVQPEPDAGAHAIDASADVFGNWRHCFSHARVHDRLEVMSSFVATLQRRALQPGAAGAPWEQVAARLRYRAGSTMPEACEFALGSPHAPRAAEFAQFAGDLFAPNRPLLDAVQSLMQRVHEQFEYRANSTDVATDALQALRLRRGVCQDFAHVMIATLPLARPGRALRQRLPVDAPAAQGSRAWWAATPRMPGSRCGARTTAGSTSIPPTTCGPRSNT